MKNDFNYYCKIFHNTPTKMRALLHRYYGTPENIRNISFEEYHAKERGELFRGRKTRRYLDICMDLELKKSRYNKMLQIHESGLFPAILESDIDWESDNKKIINDSLENWRRILDTRQTNILGARTIYEFAPEIFDADASQDE